MDDLPEEPIETVATDPGLKSEDLAESSRESPGESTGVSPGEASNEANKTEQSDPIKPDTVNADETKPSDGVKSEQLASESDTKSTSETLPSEEAEVKQAPSEEVKVGHRLSEEARVEQKPSEEAIVEKEPSEEMKIEKAPSEEAKVDQTPSEEAKVVQVPSEEVKVDQVQPEVDQVKASQEIKRPVGESDASSPVGSLKIDGSTELLDWVESDGPSSSASNEPTSNSNRVDGDGDASNGDRSNCNRVDEDGDQSNQPAVPKQPSKRKQVESFEELNMWPKLLAALRAMNIKKPNDLQKALLPEIVRCKTKDFFFKTTPHSGKKTAFLISAMNRINLTVNKPQVIIVAPTADLGEYIFRSANELGRRLNVKVRQTTPDQNPNEPMNEHVIVVPCAALLEFVEKGSIDLEEVRCIIFDEVDLLINSEKRESICHKIVRKLIDKRVQLLYFSTFHGREQRAINFINTMKPLRNCFSIINLTDRDFNRNVLQFYTYSTDPKAKLRTLIKVLENSTVKKIALYVTSSDHITTLTDHLKRNNFQTVHLTSGATAPERLAAIDRFNASKTQTILILSYPMTHGIRLHDVQMVINYDLPPNDEELVTEYVHIVSQCKVPDERPFFVVNMTDKEADKRLSRIVRFIQAKMIELKV